MKCYRTREERATQRRREERERIKYNRYISFFLFLLSFLSFPSLFTLSPFHIPSVSRLFFYSYTKVQNSWIFFRWSEKRKTQLNFLLTDGEEPLFCLCSLSWYFSLSDQQTLLKMWPFKKKIKMKKNKKGISFCSQLFLLFFLGREKERVAWIFIN